MSRRGLDRALVLLLAPLWLAVVGLHLRQTVRGGIVWIPLYVEPAGSTQEPPRFVGSWPSPTHERTSLAPGDALLSVGGVDLTGAGRVGFLVRAYTALGAEPTPDLVAGRKSAREVVPLPTRRAGYPWRTVPVTLGFGLAGLIALWRSAGRAAPRCFGLGALAYSLHWALPFGPASAGTAPLLTAIGVGALALGGTLFMPLLLRSALLVPERTGLHGPFARRGPWAFALFGPLATSALLGAPLSGATAFRASLALNALFLATAVGVLVRNYRHADGEGRRQLRWIVYGVAVGSAPALVAALVSTLRPELWWSYELALIATALVPVCVLIAILRFHFFDIDRVITATASYTVLSILFLATLLSALPAVAVQASAATGLGTSTTQAALALGLALLVVPAQRALRPTLERVFFRERQALAAGMTRLRTELDGLSEPRVLLETAGARVADLLRLDRCAIYARAGEGFAAVLVRGAGVPPVVPGDGALPGLLEEAGVPVPAARWQRWIARRLLRGEERAALEALGASVLVPVRRGERVTAILALGEKASGDVFTPTDLALLDALADRLTARLERVDEQVLRDAERSLHAQLRSYVPAAVAEGLGRGAPIEPGEREVTVLFVDVRGYTRFAEGRRADEIFRAVNVYTQEVSACVLAHQGTVIEFHGDGLLAVFGAPGELAEKERAALEAGSEIFDRVGGLVLGEAGGEPVRLSVGVGIATGPAFVGDVQAVDRRIWGCLGNTTNLAARLQALSRELEAAIVVDATTHARGGPLAQAMRRVPRVAVGGRSEEVDVYVQPLATAPETSAGRASQPQPSRST